MPGLSAKPGGQVRRRDAVHQSSASPANHAYCTQFQLHPRLFRDAAHFGCDSASKNVNMHAADLPRGTFALRNILLFLTCSRSSVPYHKVQGTQVRTDSDGQNAPATVTTGILRYPLV